jgi:iron complex outermembrane recepter protein
MFTHPLNRLGVLALACTTSMSVVAHELAPVNVSASRTVTISEQLPVGAIVIDREMLENSTARNAADLLDTVAGLAVRRLFGVSGSRASIDLLGFGSAGNDNTLLLLNGRRLNNPDMSAINLSAIPLAAIERIEILPGSGSVLYGYGAGGGVINIVTRTAYENAAGITLGAGQYETHSADIWAAGNIGRTGVIASMHDFTSNGYRDNNEVAFRSGFADARTSLDQVVLYLTVMGDQEKLGLPGARTAAQLDSDRRGTDTPDDHAEQNGYHIMPGLEVRGDNVSLNVDTGHRQRNQNGYYAFGPYLTDIDSQTVSTRFTGQQAVGGLISNWTLGWDYQQIDSEVTFTGGGNESDRRDHHTYLHSVVAVTDRLTVTGGARHSEIVTRFRDAFSSERTRDTAESYQFGARYMPVSGFALFGNAERSVRLANFDEFSYTDGSVLRPQTGMLYSAGAEWKQGRQFSVLTVWHGTFHREITFDPDANMGWGGNVNLDDRTVREGVSLNSRWQPDKAIGITLNGSIQRARFDEGSNKGNDLPLVPERSAYAQFDWKLLESVRLSLAQRYIGQRRLGGDELNEQDKLASYTWTDAVATLQWQPVTLTAGVYNLEDKLVVDSGFFNSWSGASYYPLPGRHVMVTAGFEW